jgi:hypothetical protein
MICQPCYKAPSFMGYRRLSTIQVSNTCASFIATLKLNAHLVSQVTSNINFENDILLKRCLYASRSVSLGSMSHSLVFEGRNRMSLLYSLHQFFYFKIVSQKMTEVHT